jgi:hypothetical protein
MSLGKYFITPDFGHESQNGSARRVCSVTKAESLRNSEGEIFEHARVARPATDQSVNSGNRLVKVFFRSPRCPTAQRSLLIGPGLANVNLSLRKNFRFKETWNLQFRVESFNAFNRANFQEPGTVLGSPTLGVITSVLDARSMQLGLKRTF